jgi:ankyrin repeat protein
MDTMDPSSAEMDITPDYNESSTRDSFAGRRTAQERDNVQSRFHRAVQAGNVHVALSRIRNGADVDDPNPDGETALHTAIFCPDAVSMIDLLLKEGADIDLQNSSYQTPLVHAIDGNANINSIQLLLDNESDANIGDFQGSTALHYAMKYNPNADRLVKLLLRHDADPYKTDSDRKLPIHKVKGALTDENGVEITGKVINALIQHDLVHNRVDSNKKSALFYAAQLGTTG